MKLLVPLIALGLLCGCSFTYTEIGVPIPEAHGFEIGRSTKADVLHAIGAPRLVRQQFDGELYTWRRTRQRRVSITILPVYVQAFHYASGESRRDELSLLFDREGILRGAGRRLETEEGD